MLSRTKKILDEANKSLVERLRNHVQDRGGPTHQNGAWEMMLEAADRIESQQLDIKALTLRLEEAAKLTLKTVV
jgi:hypothetical protein